MIDLEKLFNKIEQPLEIACIFGVAYLIGRFILYYLGVRGW